MLNLIPDWANHYEEFFQSIIKRNDWFIKLRYFAVLILVLFLVLGETLLSFNLNSLQVKIILSVSVLILTCNLCFNVLNKNVDNNPFKISCMQLSLLMMITDLIFLTILVYFTGVFFSPLFMLYVFHMIIGSLILPGSLVYILAGIISIVNTLLSLFIHLSIVPKFTIQGVVNHLNDHSIGFEVLFSIVFGFVLFTIVYLANTIAKDLYKRENELRISLEKLNAAEIAKQKYTLGIVHEIKTPIIAVKSILEILLANLISPLNPEVEEKIKRAKIRSEEAIDLINDVLKFSKIKLLDAKFNDILDLDSLIKNIIDKKVDEIRIKKINFDYKNKTKKKLFIKCDKSLIELALSNLISNAIKFTTNDGNIFVILTESEKCIEIEISDDGIGIPEKELSQIFSELYRASNAKREGIEGSGMGLTIVKEIVEKHSGTIKIFSPSKIGKTDKPGTTVIINLPKLSNQLS